MTVRSKNVRVQGHPIETRLEAVRQRMYGELSFQETLDRYGISKDTLSGWLKKYRSEVLRRESAKGIPLYVLNKEDDMDKHEHEELERLRREVATLRLVNRTWEILAELGKERYAIDLKKTSRRRCPPSSLGAPPRGRGNPRNRGALPGVRLQQAGVLPEPTPRRPGGA